MNCFHLAGKFFGPGAALVKTSTVVRSICAPLASTLDDVQQVERPPPAFSQANREAMLDEKTKHEADDNPHRCTIAK